jgi:hypothetical protein
MSGGPDYEAIRISLDKQRKYFEEEAEREKKLDEAIAKNIREPSRIPNEWRGPTLGPGGIRPNFGATNWRNQIHYGLNDPAISGMLISRYGPNFEK